LIAVWERARLEFAHMTKPREIEGVLDTVIIRPLGFVFVQLLRRTRTTPNMVSVAAMLAGVCIGLSYLLWYRQPLGAWLGLAFMVLHSGLDAADGQLARVTGRASRLGRIVDGLCDNVTFVAIYLAIVLGYAFHGGAHPWLVLLMAAAAGFSHSTHCALTELERMLFLNYVLGTHDTVAEQP
jgi:phosphatidylglycerophosphate synthase